jgi:hypothetical protein
VTLNSVRSIALASALAAALVAASAASASAQSEPLAPAVPQSTPLTPGQPYRQTIAVNAVALPFGMYSADFERALSSGITLGIGGSYVDWIDSPDHDAWFDVKALYYPGEEALKGFAVGITAGYHEASEDVDLFGAPLRQDGAPTLGVVMDYNWLLGKKHRFLVGLGIGAKRVLKDLDDDSALTPVLPSGRFSIGLAF